MGKVQTEPDCREQVRRETIEPDVRAVVRGSGLSTRRDFVREPRRDSDGIVPGSTIHHTLKQGDHDTGHQRVEDLRTLRLGVPQNPSLSVLDPEDRERPHLGALVRERGVGLGHLQGPHLNRSDGRRGVTLDLASNPHTPRGLGHALEPDLLGQLDGDQVLRSHQARAKGHRTLETA